MTRFKNLKEEKEFYREKYGVKSLRGQTLIDIAKNEEVSEAFMNENMEKCVDGDDGSFWLRKLFFQYQNMTVKFIEKQHEEQNIAPLAANQKVGLETLDLFFDYLDPKLLLTNPTFPEDRLSDILLEVFKKDPTDILTLGRKRKFSEEFIAKNLHILQQNLDFGFYEYQDLSFDFYKQNKENINWKDASEHMKFTNEQKIELMDYINWNAVIEHNENSYGDDKIEIPFEVIDRYSNFFDLEKLSYYHEFPEWFLRKHHHSISNRNFWDNNKNLSEQFFTDFEYRIDIKRIGEQKNVPRDIIINNIRKIPASLVGLHPLPEKDLYNVDWSPNRMECFNAFVETQDFSKDTFDRNENTILKIDISKNERLNPAVKKLIKLKTMFKS